MILENCRFEDHSTGISARKGSEVFLTGCCFSNCSTGVDATDSCTLHLDGVTFEQEEGKFGIVLETEKVTAEKVKEVYKEFKDLPR